MPEDTLVWQGEKDGRYSVRSAYHLLGEERRRLLPGSSTAPNDNLWQKIWHVQLPNRVRNFVWRLAKNILPTRGNLSKKGVKIEPLCPFCNSDIEIIEHLFMKCNIAKLVWFSSCLGIHVPENKPLND
jgi:hypothetical protein